MEVVYKGKKLIPDNDISFIALIIGSIESVDPYAIMSVDKQPEDYKFKISISSSNVLNPIMDSLVDLGRIFGMYFRFSKSIKSSSTINFSIKNLEN